MMPFRHYTLPWSVRSCSFLSFAGESGKLCVLVHRSTWETDQPAYELYDADKHVSCWMHEVPTTDMATKLLEEHGEPSEDAE
jgi:hypothetical protein